MTQPIITTSVKLSMHYTSSYQGCITIILTHSPTSAECFQHSEYTISSYKKKARRKDRVYLYTLLQPFIILIESE